MILSMLSLMNMHIQLLKEGANFQESLHGKIFLTYCKIITNKLKGKDVGLQSWSIYNEKTCRAVQHLVIITRGFKFDGKDYIFSLGTDETQKPQYSKILQIFTCHNHARGKRLKNPKICYRENLLA